MTEIRLLELGEEERPHVFVRRDLLDGRIADLVPLTFGRARINVGPAGSLGYDDAF